MTDFSEQSVGQPYPLGATLDQSGCNFAVHSPDAEKVLLCLFAADTEALITEVELLAKTGKVWHGHINGIQAGQYYAFRTQGKKNEENSPFDVNKLLIDPYAKALNRPLFWNAKQYAGDSQFMQAKSVVVASSLERRNRPQKPAHHLADALVYETHVKGMTANHPDVPDAHKGKFLGLCHPKVMAHLKGMGVTCVQLMPIMAFMPEKYITEKGLTNYWGYNPINYFAPDPRYVVSDGIAECQHMVDELHKAGIEVILDVVFNHTAESGADGPVLSFRGFDNKAFYLFDRNDDSTIDYSQYVNNSGCGNSVNTANPYVLKMVMDALRYWVDVMGVDGFRFDLAASLGREPFEFSSLAGFFRTIRQDPSLSNVKLIAEPWDVGYGGYRLGQFPSNWCECNDQYRDTVRAFWRGDKGLTSDFATRILGSRDIFHKGKRSIHSSVNYVTYHDGFTLQDLVSYEHKHNNANLEENRDGHGHNLSANYGWEGATQDPNINAIRERQKRNMFATLLMSQGVPHILGGDELSRTQLGNNNAYCQDNAINWFNWSLNERQQDFLDFCQYVIALRQQSRILKHLCLEDDQYLRDEYRDKVRWYRPDGAKKEVQDWHNLQNQAFAVELLACQGEDREHWLLVFNASDIDTHFSLPENQSLSSREVWQCKLDTRYAKLADMAQTRLIDEIVQTQQSLAIFKRIGKDEQER